MVDLDLRTLRRNLLLIVGILSFLVIAEMILVSAEEPATSDASQPALYQAAKPAIGPRSEINP
jgi:hypothetical protein